MLWLIRIGKEKVMTRGIFAQIAVTGLRKIMMNNTQNQLLANYATNAKLKKRTILAANCKHSLSTSLQTQTPLCLQQNIPTLKNQHI